MIPNIKILSILCCIGAGMFTIGYFCNELMFPVQDRVRYITLLQEQKDCEELGGSLKAYTIGSVGDGITDKTIAGIGFKCEKISKVEGWKW